MGFSSGEKAGRRPWLPRRSRHFLDPARRASGGTASLGTPVLAVSLSRQRSLPVLRPSCSAAETPAKAKIENCFSGTFTATVAVPFPGLGVVSAAITLQTNACLTEQSHSAPQNFSSLPPPPPPLQDTPPVISCVNHTGCLKTWSRISPTVVSSFLYEYPLGYIALYTPLTNIL